MKGLIVKVYRNSMPDCTNGGVSSTHDEVLLVGKGVPEVFESRDDMPVLKLVKRIIFGREYVHATPIDRPGMFGGNFIYSSDSRFPNAYPIAVHDRVE